ncbi:MAG: hypothetical protein FWC23_05995 [Chitinispirillia bacterium]|nr:hypothetical protein [Chitinispirillia bacterium]MCL2268718.1 hypothetical protein [Chitinispirillia bacterium]
MSITITNPIEIRKAGMKALTEALGYDNTQEFLKQFSGTGNFTEDRHKWNPQTDREIDAGIMKLQADMEQGILDRAGRPIQG